MSAAVSLLNLSPAEFCAATEACPAGRDWALTQPTMSDVWDNCPRVDWLLWIADKMGKKPDDRTLRRFAVWCARNTPLSDGRKTGDLLTDPRSLAALEVAERFADGQATNDELDAARAAAEAAAWAGAEAGAAGLLRGLLRGLVRGLPKPRTFAHLCRTRSERRRSRERHTKDRRL